MSDESYLGLKDLVTAVREELEAVDADRRAAGQDALLALRDLTLRIQFVAVSRRDGKLGFDLRVLTAGGGRGTESQTVQELTVTYEVSEEARRRAALGTRAHSSAAATTPEREIEALE